MHYQISLKRLIDKDIEPKEKKLFLLTCNQLNYNFTYIIIKNSVVANLLL